MKNSPKIRISAVTAAILSLGALGLAHAQVGNVTIWADDDNSRGERLLLQAGGTALASGNNAISGGAAFVQIDSSDFIIVQTDGLLYLNSSEARISNNANIAGTATIGNGAVVTGNTTINATGGGATNIGSASSINTVLGTTSFTGSTNSTGAFTQLGTTSITGTTSINGSGSLNTTIGNAANTTTIQSGTNTITGASNSMLSTGANTITAVSNNNISAATNNLTGSTANNIQGPLNNIGTSSSSDNYIGNTLSGTKVTATAGNARQALTNGSANTTVTAGTSGLTARVGKPNVATTGQVLLSNTGGTTVDANGKILVSTATAYVSPTAPTAAMTLTNGYGNTHGLVVTESQTTLSGGTESSSMILSDRAATFSNAQTGAPITVTGVADGRADFDAVNVRQFAGAIAAVAAQANIPALAAGQDRTFGVGMGNFMGKSALALGMSMRGNNNSVYKATMSTGLNSGMQQTVIGVGGAWGF